MTDAEPTKAELRAEIRALKKQLARLRRQSASGGGGDGSSERPASGEQVSQSDEAESDEAEADAASDGDVSPDRASSPHMLPLQASQAERPGEELPTFIEQFPEALLIVGPNDTVRYANTAAVRLGQAPSRPAMLASPVDAYVRPIDREPSESSRAHSVTTAIGEGSFSPATLLCDDGTTVPVEVASAPITFCGEDATLLALHDLRGRHRMAETVTRTLNLFDRAFHLGPAALLIARLHDGMILEVSDRLVELFGFSPTDLIGQSLAELDIGLDAETRLGLARSLLDDGTVRGRELRLRRADGTQRVVLCSARIIEIDGKACALVSLVDITKRKKATLAEKESRTLLHKIFRASPAPIAIYDLDTERYLDVNEAMCSLIGYPHDEIVAQTPAELDIWVDEARRHELMRRLREQEAVYDFKVRFRTASGKEVTTLSSFQRIQVEGRTCVLAVMTDITQREEARQALVEAKEKAEDARKKAEDVAQFRSSVLSNMTHEVRTPLTVILGFTSMLREGVQPEYKRFVDLIERSGRRLLLTLDSLLDLAQLEAGTLSVDDAVESVPDAVHSLAGSFSPRVEEEGLTLSLDLPSPQTSLCARMDTELFERVLNHLIDNAVKFTRDGTVTLRVRGDRERIRVQVEDTGGGISQEFLPRIFEAFAQESEGDTRTHQGSGLGLTVSKRIVERMNGTIDIQSTKGQGTTVTVALPRVQATGKGNG